MRKTPAAQADLLTQSQKDCIDDCAEVLYLVNGTIRKIQSFLRDIQRTRSHILPAVFHEKTQQAMDLRNGYKTRADKIREMITLMTHAVPTARLVQQTELGISEIRDHIRTNQTILGAIITGTDWQSPSFAHSVRSLAGRQTGTIYPTINDYKRDQHWDGHTYELSYRKELIDGFIKIPINVYATASGMAAFSTILTYLILEHKAEGKIIVGKSVYFENKALILSAFGNNCIEVDETDMDAVLSAISQNQPSVIFLDSLTNSSEIMLPDLKEITSRLSRSLQTETILVVDNTCLSIAYQPYPLVFGKRSKLRLIVFESLNKYHQFGLDRVTGGIIWTYGGDTGNLFDYRVHCGTNIQDSVVASLPVPSRKHLTRRLSRHARNATALATALQQWMNAHPDSPFERVSYPGLSNHPSYAWSQALPFTGSFLVPVFKPRYRTVPYYKKFVARCIAEAKRMGVRLVSGTSFGLDVTRVYLTAVRSHTGTPFIRIAAGTETEMTFEKVTALFISVLSKTR